MTIAFSYRLGHSTVCEIVKETCTIIYRTLSEMYMICPNSDQWLEIAREFWQKWNFPNCLGGIDGKHVNIQAPPSSGSLYYNYKNTHSIVLMAAVSANYEFIVIDVGSYGRNSDGGIFASSNFGKSLEAKTLGIPDNKNLPGTAVTMPHVFVGDEAFPLKEYLLRPYPGRNISQDKRIFNYRLSRARRVSENAFGILAARWRFLRRLIQAHPSTAGEYVKAACALHNFLISKTKSTYCPPSFVDQEVNGTTVPGEWRNETADPVNGLQNIGRVGSNNNSRSVIKMRNDFCTYLNSPRGSVPWQNNVVLH